MQVTSGPGLALAIAAMLLNSAAAQAQTAPMTPALGATSPLSGMGSATSGSPTGIPLGATEINPGGLSPGPCSSMASVPSPIGSSQSPMAGSSQTMPVPASAGSSFDGGGMLSSACSAGMPTTISLG